MNDNASLKLRKNLIILFINFRRGIVRRKLANWVTILKVSVVMERRHKYLCCRRSLTLLLRFSARWTHAMIANVCHFNPPPSHSYICFDFYFSTYVLLNISKSLILLILEFLRKRLICNMNERWKRNYSNKKVYFCEWISTHKNTWNECGANRRQLEHMCVFS